MKSILLATASIVAFAGAAAAQNITFGGEAELGFNDDEEDGFFYTADLIVSFTTQLDNGLTATVDFTLPVVDSESDDDSDTLNSADYVLAIEAEGFGGLFFGDTAFAAETHWDPGFAMKSDGVSEQDNETVLRGESVIGGFDVALSAVVSDGGGDRPGLGGVIDLDGDPLTVDPFVIDGGRDYVDQISFGASGAIGVFALDLAYQEESQLADTLFGDADGDGDDDGDDQEEDIEGIYDSSNEDFSVDEIFAIAAGATFGGADVKLGYSTNLTADTNSYGLLVRYPFGPVTASASYTIEPDFEEDSWKIAAEYDAGGPIVLSAYFESEVNDEEYGIEAVYKPSELTTFAIGYIEDTNDDFEDGTFEIDDDQDEGFYVQARQAIGENAYVEGSYAEFGDAGPDEVREGTTLLVGLTF